MKIRTLKECVMLCRASGITPFIWGQHGLGKSSIVRQLADDNGMGFIDLRCSQIESADVRGLPDAGEDGRTHYLPPADLPVGDMTALDIATELGQIVGVTGDSADEIGGKIAEKLATPDLTRDRLYLNRLQELQPRHQNGILFIDEVNRAADDVLQAIFQLVLDRKVGQYVLPPGWSVVAAGNFADSYIVSGFNDPAFVDRFCHLRFASGESTMEEWIEYMVSIHGSDVSDVIAYATQNIAHIDGNVETGDMGFTIQPSRRSWDRVVEITKHKDEFSNDAMYETIAGLVGQECAIGFTQFACPVRPIDIIKHGVKAHESKLNTLNRNQMQGLMWGIVSYVHEKLDNEKIADMCLDFAEYMVHNIKDKDLVAAFCVALVNGGSQNPTRVSVITNPKLAKMVAKFGKTDKKKTFIDRLVARPDLQKALSGVTWGV